MSTGKAPGAKARGCQAERLLRDWLRRRGYEAVRAAGSLGRCDVLVPRHSKSVDRYGAFGLELKYKQRKPTPAEIFRAPHARLYHTWYVMGVWWKPGVKIEDAVLWPSEESMRDGVGYRLEDWFPDHSQEGEA